MKKAFLLAIIENILFFLRLLVAIPTPKFTQVLLRILLFPIIWLALFVLTCVHFLFFLLDELLFPAYRQVNISQPVFIVGIPRSGTTWLHRVLAKDQRSTTLTMAEALFAPSISQRYLLLGLRHCLKPLSLVFKKVRFQPLKQFDTVHKIRFSEPEEDFLLFLPLHACFLLTILCPTSKHYWSLARFDDALSEKKKQIVLKFYKLCVKKHLFFHGEQRSFLSKNPSFTPFISSLKSEFQDAQIVACTRSPLETVPSQLGSLTPAQNLIGSGIETQIFNTKMIDVLLGYYAMISAHKEAIEIIDMPQLQQDLENTVKKLYLSSGKVMHPEFANEIRMLAEKGKAYKSEHAYDLSKFDLTEKEIKMTFSRYWTFEPEMS